ncbi:Ribonuclease HII [Lawsonella clevelandensis]|mgnify:FL=1|uniref:Ribonuclease HII n=2 Tax=Lawsonella clevelandensis TaxID=1528099 RepID=A0A5E3ZWS6_9ACTN|nr:ribonuclease HII [Lawsonella clevelandensis]MDU7194076.1 ribonuclease HII [Lawsonella clevelandensis]VHN99831.1 Ribonuclease HII [Lawsonella clevelandensis]
MVNKTRDATHLHEMEEMLIAHGCGPVAGVDEAGRGACAGPLTIAACILPDVCIPDLAGLTDSKKLTPARRERLFPLIQEHAVAWSIVHFSATEVDEIGIQRANIEGMRRAVARLNVLPGYVLTDGFPVPGLPMPSLSVLKGDANVSCIAAASVLAKVSRDHIMVGYDEAFPEYGFAGHKGYATASHQAAMEHYGVSPIHRMSYANVAKAHSIAGMR